MGSGPSSLSCGANTTWNNHAQACIAPDPPSFCGANTAWDTGKCTAPSPDTFCSGDSYWDGEKCIYCETDSHWDGEQCVNCPTDSHWDGEQCANCPPADFRWNGKECIQRVKAISELRLGSNSDPPYGYKAKEGSGPCECAGSGYGLSSCKSDDGNLCCGSSPYNSLKKEDKENYYGGDESKLCWERDYSIDPQYNPNVTE